MALSNHFLLLDQPKMRLFLVDKATIQVPLDRPKIQVCEVRESNVSNGRQALETHFLPLDQHKMRLGCSREGDVSRVSMSL